MPQPDLRDDADFRVERAPEHRAVRAWYADSVSSEKVQLLVYGGWVSLPRLP